MLGVSAIEIGSAIARTEGPLGLLRLGVETYGEFGYPKSTPIVAAFELEDNYMDSKGGELTIVPTHTSPTRTSNSAPKRTKVSGPPRISPKGRKGVLQRWRLRTQTANGDEGQWLTGGTMRRGRTSAGRYRRRRSRRWREGL